MRIAGHTYTHSPTVLVTKYTGLEFSKEEYETERGAQIMRLATDIMSLEYGMLSTARDFRKLADKIEENIMAGPNDEIYQLSQRGELYGSSMLGIDMDIVRRQERIGSMHMLAESLRRDLDAAAGAKDGH